MQLNSFCETFYDGFKTEKEVFSHPDGLQLQEVGDFGDENCLPPLNLIRSTNDYLTNKPPISCRCC
jgi:hypothetical protein